MEKKYGGGYREAHANGQSHGCRTGSRARAGGLLDGVEQQAHGAVALGVLGLAREVAAAAQPSWPSAKVQRPVLKKRLHLT